MPSRPFVRLAVARLAVALAAFVLVTASAPHSAAAALDDIGARLDALETGGADARRRAEAELSEALAPTDVPVLAAWIGEAEAEGRARLASALARRDAALAIVLDLARHGDGTGPVADVVRGALDGLVARFEPGFFAEPATGYALRELLDRRAETGAPALGRLDLARPPLDVVRDLARWDGMPLRLVVDPALVGAPAPPASAFRDPAARDGTTVEGTWRELLAALELFDLSFEAHLLEPESELDEPQIAFVRVTRRGLDGRVTARTWLARLLERLDDAQQPREAREAARALASTGWPAAQALLLDRYRGRGDRAALAGLVWAAELGVAPPSFPTRADAAAALAAVDADLVAAITPGTRPGSFARDVLEGLVQLPRLAPDGGPLFDEPLVPTVTDGLAARRRTAFALEFTARARIDAPGLRERLHAWIVDERVAPNERRWALSAWARLFTEPAPSPARPTELLHDVRDRQRADEWVWLLAASGAPLPATWSSSEDGAVFEGLTPRALSIALAWAFAREDVGVAAACVRAAIGGPVDGQVANTSSDYAGRREVARVLDLVRRRSGAPACEAVLARVLDVDGSADAALAVLELRAVAGLVPIDDEESRALLYDRAVARRSERAPGDPELLATLTVGRDGARARSLLLGDFVVACESAPGARALRERVDRALSDAMAVLLAADEDQLARRLASDLRRLARERVGQGLGGDELVLAARSGDWPRPTGWDAEDLSRPGAFR